MSLNGVMLQAFHWYLPTDGEHWHRVAEQAAAWRRLGVTAVWLPPMAKGWGGPNSVGYDIYDHWDLGAYDVHGSVRTKYGTFEQLRRAVAACHDEGLHVYGDLVFNHKMGARHTQRVRVQQVDPNQLNLPLGDWHERDIHTHFRFDARLEAQAGGQTLTSNTFEWQWDHFDAVEVEEDGQLKTFRLKDKCFECAPAHHHGGPPYLMGCNVDTMHPQVIEELYSYGRWLLDVLHLDGFRLDAVKHIRTAFYRDFLRHLREHHGQAFFAVGEFWADDVQHLHAYLDRIAQPLTLFDVPLQRRFYEASRIGAAYDLGSLFQGTLVKERPWAAVTFVGNHDTQPLQSLERPVEPWFVPLAYAAILLREQGYPCVFLPDLTGAHYRDRGRDGREHDIVLTDHGGVLQRLLEARQQFAHGPQRDYFDHWHCVGWTRRGDAEHPRAMAVLMSNADDAEKTMHVGRPHATFADHLGHVDGTITADANGQATFRTRGGKVSVWVEV